MLANNIRGPLLLSAICLISTLSYPREADQLECEVCITYGEFGPLRTATSVQGDSLSITARIKGFRDHGDSGADLAIQATLLDAAGKKVVSLKEDVQAIPHFGGDELPIHAKLSLPPKMAKGKFTLVFSVTDKQSKMQAEDQIEVVIDSELDGIHERNLVLSYDRDGKVPILSNQSVGQRIYLKCELVGIHPEAGEIEIDIRGELIDLQDNTTVAALNTLSIQKTRVDSKTPFVADVTLDEIFANRNGRYCFRMSFDDRINKKTREVLIPLTVRQMPR
jgi:hypothetical protein